MDWKEVRTYYSRVHANISKAWTINLDDFEYSIRRPTGSLAGELRISLADQGDMFILSMSGENVTDFYLPHKPKLAKIASQMLESQQYSVPSQVREHILNPLEQIAAQQQ